MEKALNITLQEIMETDGVHGVLVSDRHGLCLGAKGVGQERSSGMLTALFTEALKIEPKLPYPTIVLESQRKQCVVQESLAACVFVSIVWGVTNVFIKRSTVEITKVTGRNWIERARNELMYLLKNWKYLMTFGCNQLGSIVFYLTLAVSDISLVVPVANSLTFVVTAITAVFFGERLPNSKVIAGSILVIIGTTCCVWDKVLREAKSADIS